jgi:hypothetical protein
MTGMTTTTKPPSMCVAGDAGVILSCPKKTRLVKKLIRDRRATATYALMTLMRMATDESRRRRALAVKSPSACRALSSSCPV